MYFQMFKLDLEKSEEPEIKLLTFVGSSKERKRVPEKNNYFCFIVYANAFDCVENSSRDGIPDYLTYLLRNLYANKEATVRIGHVTTD